jgi:hypothetical protein
MEALQNKRFYSEVQGASLWHNYIGERRTTFANTYGIKVRCYEEHVE